MKTILKSVLVMTLVFAFTTNSDAQQRSNNPDQKQGQRLDRQEQMDRPHTMKGVHHQKLTAKLNLTDEQQEQMKELRLDGQKEMLALRNQLREKNARLRTLTTAEKYDQKAVSSLVEEIGEIRTQMMAKRVEQHQKIRTLLTDEQRMKFDTFHNRRGSGKYMQHGFRK